MTQLYPTHVKQLIDENSNSEIISDKKKILLRNSTITLLISVTHKVNFFSDCSAFENQMSSANVGEPFILSTVSLESLEIFVRSLKNSSPGHDEITIPILK